METTEAEIRAINAAAGHLDRIRDLRDLRKIMQTDPHPSRETSDAIATLDEEIRAAESDVRAIFKEVHAAEAA